MGDHVGWFKCRTFSSFSVSRCRDIHAQHSCFFFLFFGCQLFNSFSLLEAALYCLGDITPLGIIWCVFSIVWLRGACGGVSSFLVRHSGIRVFNCLLMRTVAFFVTCLVDPSFSLSLSIVIRSIASAPRCVLLGGAISICLG